MQIARCSRPVPYTHIINAVASNIIGGYGPIVVELATERA